MAESLLKNLEILTSHRLQLTFSILQDGLINSIYLGQLKTLKPYGVVGQIIPWNFPLLMLAWKIAPALATGNTVVLKPAETTPLTALLFAEICEQAGLPAGVVNIVTGDGSTGSQIVNHKDINKIAFTGSTQVGKLIQKSLAGRDVGLTLELGGKAANIVYEDAAIDQAVEGVVNGIFFNQGHVCCAGSRLLLQESIHDQFISKLEKRMQSLRVGNPLDKNTDIGAINSKEQLDKITNLVNEGLEDGGELFQTECELPGNGSGLDHHYLQMFSHHIQLLEKKYLDLY